MAKISSISLEKHAREFAFATNKDFNNPMVRIIFPRLVAFAFGISKEQAMEDIENGKIALDDGPLTDINLQFHNEDLVGRVLSKDATLFVRLRS